MDMENSLRKNCEGRFPENKHVIQKNVLESITIDNCEI